LLADPAPVPLRQNLRLMALRALHNSCSGSKSQSSLADSLDSLIAGSRR
jgi:hypothetical protein